MRSVLALLAVLLCLSVLAVGALLVFSSPGGFIESSDTSAVGEAITDAQREAVRSATGVPLPTSTVYHAYHYESALDQALLALVSMPTADADSLLARAPLADADWTSTADVPHRLSDMPEWPLWTPDAVTVGRWAALDLAPGRRLALLVDERAPDTRTLYLLWNTY